MADRQKCYCGRNMLNEHTAFATVGMHVCCSNMCKTEAMDDLRAREIEPQSVSGSMNGYSFTHKGWDVT